MLNNSGYFVVKFEKPFLKLEEWPILGIPYICVILAGQEPFPFALLCQNFTGTR